jgi:hypothetical protein
MSLFVWAAEKNGKVKRAKTGNANRILFISINFDKYQTII